VSQHGYPPRRDWKAQAPWRPVFTPMNILDVLNVYRRWYEEGLSDKEISARIFAKYTLPHNPNMRPTK